MSDATHPERRWIQRVITYAVMAVGLLLAFFLGRALSTPETDVSPAGAPDSEAGPMAEAEGVEYVCPMHPNIRQDNPGICPICEMDLVAVSSGPASENAVPGVSLSDEARALADLRLAPVERVPLTRELDVFGHLATDQGTEVVVTAWTAGRIQRLYVDTVGETVRRGQRLARVYSPQLVIAQETLLHALGNLEQAERSGSGARASAASAAVSAARSELRLLGLAEDQIADIVEEGVAEEYVDIRAPASGTVITRHARRGDYVQVGAQIVSLADLDELWAELEIYERDLPLVRLGMPVSIAVPGAQQPHYDAQIDFIEPVFDRQRRIAKARVVLENPSGDLRPDMFVQATIYAEVGDGQPPVSVPATAVLWTGRRSLVYVYDAVPNPPVFMPIEVTLGPRVGDRYVIDDGVWPGEQVVVNGAFRIDASLQIRGLSGSMMQTGGHDGHSH